MAVKVNELLKKEYDDNSKKIDDLNYKLRIISANSLDRKISFCIALALVPWILITFSTSFIASIDLIPLELVQPLSILLPGLIGLTGQQIIYKNNNYKDKLKEFSNSKNDNELFFEYTKYNLEKTKLCDKNKVLKKAYDELINNELLLEKLKKRYVITEKVDNEVLSESVSIKLDKELKKLENDSTKNFLINNFWQIRDKFQNIQNFIFFIGLGFFIPFSLYNLPSIEINMMNLPLQTNFFEMFALGIVGAGMSSLYLINKNNNKLIAFNSINDELKNEKLERYSSNYESYHYEQELSKQIDKVANLKLYLESTKKQKEEIKENIVNYKNTLIKAIEQYLPITYKNFKELDLDEQQKIIDKVKEQQGNVEKDLFQQRFDSYFENLDNLNSLKLTKKRY